jgi:hypothetical protein
LDLRLRMLGTTLVQLSGESLIKQISSKAKGGGLASGASSGTGGESASSAVRHRSRKFRLGGAASSAGALGQSGALPRVGDASAMDQLPTPQLSSALSAVPLADSQGAVPALVPPAPGPQSRLIWLFKLKSLTLEVDYNVRRLCARLPSAAATGCCTSCTS